MKALKVIGMVLFGGIFILFNIIADILSALIGAIAGK